MFKGKLSYESALFLVSFFLFPGCSKEKYIEKTDSKGIVTFEIKETEEQVSVEVLDKESLIPIKNIRVKYYDYKDVKAFLAIDQDKNYFPQLELYEHNSSHII